MLHVHEVGKLNLQNEIVSTIFENTYLRHQIFLHGKYICFNKNCHLEQTGHAVALHIHVT